MKLTMNKGRYSNEVLEMGKPNIGEVKSPGKPYETIVEKAKPNKGTPKDSRQKIYESFPAPKGPGVNKSMFGRISNATYQTF